MDTLITASLLQQSRSARDWRGLWILALVYFAFAVMSTALVKRRQAHG